MSHIALPSSGVTIYLWQHSPWPRLIAQQLPPCHSQQAAPGCGFALANVCSFAWANKFKHIKISMGVALTSGGHH